MFASTQDLEFVQGQSRDVPDRELGPNITTLPPWPPSILLSFIMKCVTMLVKLVNVLVKGSSQAEFIGFHIHNFILSSRNRIQNVEFTVSHTFHQNSLKIIEFRIVKNTKIYW